MRAGGGWAPAARFHLAPGTARASAISKGDLKGRSQREQPAGDLDEVWRQALARS